MAKAVDAPRAVAIYTRISSDVDHTELGVKRQERECRELARRKGWKVIRVYTDNDVSAYRGKPRPRYRQMLADLGAGVVDGLVSYHLDRLHRHPKELEEFFEVCDRARVRFLATVTGDIDLSKDDGRFHARILGAVARKESDDKSRRIKSKHAELALAGKPNGGTRPFGYESDHVAIRADEAKVIREGAKRLLRGHSLMSVVKAWNAAGSKTVAGRSWYPSAVRRVLMSARIGGMREHEDEIVGKAVWPAIISATDSTRLRALLRDPSRRKSKGNGRKYLLTGMATCGVCGAKLVARPRGDGRRAMVCASQATGGRGCGKIRVLADPFEEHVASQLFDFVDTPRLAQLVAEEQAALQRNERTQRPDEAFVLAKQLEDLAEDYAAGRLTKGEWIRARTVLKKRLDAARQSQVNGQPSRAIVIQFARSSGVLRRQWSSLDLADRRAIAGAVMSEVRVGPAIRGLNRFDERRITVLWRD